MMSLFRRVCAVVSASLVLGTVPGVAVAGSSFSGSSSAGQFPFTLEMLSVPQVPTTNTSPTPFLSADIDGGTTSGIDGQPGALQEVDGPFAQWGIPTPPGAEGYRVNQATDEELHPQGLDEWHPTTNPKNRVIPGQMRSDKQTIPAGIGKAHADAAEIREAQLTSPDTPTLNTGPGCSVYWPANFEVCGVIKQKYDSVGGPTSFLLLPKSNELTNPDGVGKRSEFVNGFIYWHPNTGAHTVSLPVSLVWARHGWEQGFLGYPTTSDIPQGNNWYKQDFQGGHVYTHNDLPPSQASIQGAIYDKWQSMGAQTSELGYPISDELTTPDGVGRYNVFEGGMIYWTPQHGAYSVSGGIRAAWAAQGYEKSKLGYPIGDMFINPQGVQEQHFEGGVLYADPNVFWQPFSCLNAATRIASTLGLVDEVQFMCSNRGVSLSVNGQEYFGMPTVEDVAKAISIPSLQSAEDSQSPIGIGCDVYRSSWISEPRRYSDYKVSKNVRFCIGATKRVSPFKAPEPKWSREFNWTISDSLKQRRFADASVIVNSLDLPGLQFKVRTRLRKDIRGAADKSFADSLITVNRPALHKAINTQYEIPEDPGVYFTEVVGLSLEIPSWGYNQRYGAFRFAIGRYTCPPYSPETTVCVFSNPVDDHT